ncbi:nuclear transport factor 2 family protein [Komagataeibacter rhaeticus]|nr:nuclear transport factor 2 family protein [Komagataeibacter rhaeticus]
MHLEVTMLFEEYGRLLDADSLEAWTTLFVPDCRYEIMSRENIEQNLPLSLMLCDSRDMLDDRVYSLREANVFNIHYDCHIIGPVRVTPQGDGWTATTAYSLFQSIQAGRRACSVSGAIMPNSGAWTTYCGLSGCGSWSIPVPS